MNTDTEPRTYVIGLPVVIVVHQDGRVEMQVDTSEVGSAILEEDANYNEYDEDQVDADSALVEQWHHNRIKE